ncbi:MAG: hypothetical protein ABIA08_00430 [bacterium]
MKKILVCIAVPFIVISILVSSCQASHSVPAARTEVESISIKDPISFPAEKYLMEFSEEELPDYFFNESFPKAEHLPNPTYQTVRDFLRKDATKRHDYIPDEYVCHHFAKAFSENALKAGIRAGYVYLDLFSESKHAINVFETTDYGLVFVSPQRDGIVKIEPDQVSRIVIFWNDASPTQKFFRYKEVSLQVIADSLSLEETINGTALSSSLMSNYRRIVLELELSRSQIELNSSNTTYWITVNTTTVLGGQEKPIQIQIRFDDDPLGNQNSNKIRIEGMISVLSWQVRNADSTITDIGISIRAKRWRPI